MTSWVRSGGWGVGGPGRTPCPSGMWRLFFFEEMGLPRWLFGCGDGFFWGKAWKDICQKALYFKGDVPADQVRNWWNVVVLRFEKRGTNMKTLEGKIVDKKEIFGQRAWGPGEQVAGWPGARGPESRRAGKPAPWLCSQRVITLEIYHTIVVFYYSVFIRKIIKYNNLMGFQAWGRGGWGGRWGWNT